MQTHLLLVLALVSDPLPTTSVARAHYRLGQAAQGSGRRMHFQEGIAAARAQLARDPDDPEGLLWLAANLGAEALERGKLAALKVLPEMERLLLRLDAVAPRYEHAAASRTLGRLYQKAPRWISIGSPAKARAAYERALALAPDFPGNWALAADFFDDQDDGARALQLARRVLASVPPGSPEPDAPEWRAIALRITRQADR